MKKLFNNSTKGNDTQNQASKSKHKFFKAFGFTSLAILMGAAGVFAFAPIGTTIPPIANASEISTESGGLITPKVDDPVIYTTESGLEIKWGNSAPSTTNSSLGSGNLKGFPYFTTKNASTTYTWVIIGRNSNVTTLNTAVQSYLFSTWKSNNLNDKAYVNGNYYFSNTYETTTPAGSAINNVVPSKSYVNDNISFSINGITTNDNEIPSGCVLCLSNTAITSTTWSSSNMSTVMYFSNTSNYVYQKCLAYDTNDTFGFETLLSDIQKTSLTQKVRYRINSGASTGGITSTSLKFFPLGTGGITHESGENPEDVENFKMNTYLTKSQYAISSNTWGRSNSHCDWIYYFNTSGDSIHNAVYNSSAYIRPACVLKIT